MLGGLEALLRNREIAIRTLQYDRAPQLLPSRRGGNRLDYVQHLHKFHAALPAANPAAQDSTVRRANSAACGEGTYDVRPTLFALPWQKERYSAVLLTFLSISW